MWLLTCWDILCLLGWLYNLYMYIVNCCKPIRFYILALHSSKFRMHKSKQICPVYRVSFCVFFALWASSGSMLCGEKLQEIRRYPYIRRESVVFQPFNQLRPWITRLFARILHRSHLETRKSPSQRSEDDGQ